VSTRHPTRARLVGGRYAVDGRVLRAGVVLDGVDLAGDGRRVRVRALGDDERPPPEALARLRDGDLDVAVLGPPAQPEPVGEPTVTSDPAAAPPAGRRRRAAMLAGLAAALAAAVLARGSLSRDGAALAPPAVAAPRVPASPPLAASTPLPRPRPARGSPPRRRKVAAHRAAGAAQARPRARPARALPPVHRRARPITPARADAPAVADLDGEVPPAA
jgi:hypothetical protein